MNPHQRCLQAKVKYRNEPKQVMPKCEDLSKSLEINAIWTFDTEFQTIFNKSCTYITFKSAVKHRQLAWVTAMCKAFYYSCLLRELDNSDRRNASRRHQRTNLSKSEILINHRSVLSSYGVNTKDDDIDLPSLYWIPKLHKDPYKQRFIAGSSSCSTKPLSKLLTYILTTVKEGIKKCCNSIYSHSGVNQMWILKF